MQHGNALGCICLCVCVCVSVCLSVCVSVSLSICNALSFESLDPGSSFLYADMSSKSSINIDVYGSKSQEQNVIVPARTNTSFNLLSYLNQSRPTNTQAAATQGQLNNTVCQPVTQSAFRLVVSQTTFQPDPPVSKPLPPESHV